MQGGRAVGVVAKEGEDVQAVGQEGLQSARPAVEVGLGVLRASQAQVEEGADAPQVGLVIAVTVAGHEGHAVRGEVRVDLVVRPAWMRQRDGHGQPGGPGLQQPGQGGIVALPNARCRQQDAAELLAEWLHRVRQPGHRLCRPRPASRPAS